ncbi:MAG: hypothetical protein JSU73_09575 [candidate division WOR-3 bacterium]|nr:MAG: hypothetical protein JSU73_09575 [candidate division WOR-3 bacterium]
MAAELGCALDTVQKQLKRLEKGGVISGRRLGRTTVYVLSPDYPLKRELEALLRAAQGIVEPAGSSSVREAGDGTRSRVIIRRIE